MCCLIVTKNLHAKNYDQAHMPSTLGALQVMHTLLENFSEHRIHYIYQQKLLS